MGITTITARVFTPADLSRFVELEFIVDLGAGHSVVPRSILQELGVTPHTTKRFYMVDGQSIERQVGGAAFEYAGERAYAPVVFGEEGDAALMGATTLEGFGFVLDPFRRELRPMLMRLLEFRGGTPRMGRPKSGFRRALSTHGRPSPWKIC